MSENFVVAVVAGLAALLGSLIPTISGYFTAKAQRNFEEKQILRNKQRDVYYELMLCFQKLANDDNVDNYFWLQKIALQASILGDDETAKSLNEYYFSLIESAQPGNNLLMQHEHQAMQKKLLNSMRSNFGLKPLPYYKIIGFRPNQ